MNTIPDVLPLNLKYFFYNMRNYLDTDIYFYGSSIRGDYYKNKSDVDMCIFTDNEKSMINKVKLFLNAEQCHVKKIVWRYEKEIIHGHKISFKVDDDRCEIYVYNETFKDIVVQYIRIPLNRPFYFNILLYILKFIYYTIPILPKEIYVKLKTFLMKKLIINKDSEFWVL